VLVVDEEPHAHIADRHVIVRVIRDLPHVARAEGVEDQLSAGVAADPAGAGLDPPALGGRLRIVPVRCIHLCFLSAIGARVQRCNNQAAGTVIAVVTRNSPGIDPVNVGQRSTSAIANSIAITCNRKIS